jgi:hypothetical protein
MISPNFTLFLWILLAFVVVEAIGRIVLGLMKEKKREYYDEADTVTGIILLILVLIVLLT